MLLSAPGRIMLQVLLVFSCLCNITIFNQMGSHFSQLVSSCLTLWHNWKQSECDFFAYMSIYAIAFTQLILLSHFSFHIPLSTISYSVTKCNVWMLQSQKLQQTNATIQSNMQEASFKGATHIPRPPCFNIFPNSLFSLFPLSQFYKKRVTECLGGWVSRIQTRLFCTKTWPFYI